MKVIKLSQQCTVEKTGEYGLWVPETIYEPIYIFPEHIETLASCGHTVIKMISGEKITVRESVEDICYLLGAPILVSDELDSAGVKVEGE